MEGKTSNIVKTLYLEDSARPLRISLTAKQVKRIREHQERLKKTQLKKNEVASVEMALHNGVVLITKNWIDFGNYGYEGWASGMYGENFKDIDEIPDVFFSRLFLYYLKKAEHRAMFMHVIKPEHKELLVWKKVEGTY